MCKKLNLLILLVCMGFVSGDPWSRQHIPIFCQQHDYKVRVEREGCDSNHFIVKACVGNCRSFEQPLQDVPYFTSRCQLCKAATFVKEKFELQGCTQGVDSTVLIQSASSCSCITGECY